MSSVNRTLFVVLVACGCLGLAQPLSADVFTYLNRDGEHVVVEAKLVHTARDTHVLALPDGEYRLVPETAVVKHETKPGPDPLTPAEAAVMLEDRFGGGRFRSYVDGPFVIGLVLSADLPKSSETRARFFLQNVADFMGKVSHSFKNYLRKLRVPVTEPKYPLVVLIFESDGDFEKYLADVTPSNAVMAPNVAGFYSGMTNYLSIRLRTCNTFEVPLHEAIHQQVYNRNFFQRLAPIPHWFDEGIATGFEANKGRINVGPSMISRRYARQALAGDRLSWEELLDDDSAFQGNVLVGEAYGHAWSLHWLLITKHKSEYLNYVKLLAQKRPLEREPAGQRAEDLRAAFGVEVAELQEEFNTRFPVDLKRQKVVLADNSTPGRSITEDGLGEVTLNAISRTDLNGQLEVRGVLKNVCPYRDLSFLVTVETDGGMYAQWYVPDLGINKTAPLKKQTANKIMRGGAPSSSRTYRVRIRSAAAGTPAAERWSGGEFPVPMLGRR